MREWIILAESLDVDVTFYHAARSRLPDGTVLKGYGSYTAGIQEEEILEKYRPETAFPRRSSVFMVSDFEALETAGVDGRDHVYIVEPQGEVQRYDLRWIELIGSACGMEDNGVAEFTADKQAEYANGYWSGKPAPLMHGEKTAWEYLCKAATVVELV